MSVSPAVSDSSSGLSFALSPPALSLPLASTVQGRFSQVAFTFTAFSDFCFFFAVSFSFTLPEPAPPPP